MNAFADDPILAAGFDYWMNLPRVDAIPDRRDVDPVQMPKQILSNVALEFDENFGVSLKGKTTVELTDGDYRDYMLNHFRVLMDNREAVYSESAFRWDFGGHLRTRRILMPLSHGEPGVPAMIFKVQTWPKEEMRGLPFCDVIANAKHVGNTPPRVVRRSDE
jgi:hypothetical protein